MVTLFFKLIAFPEYYKGRQDDNSLFKHLGHVVESQENSCKHETCIFFSTIFETIKQYIELKFVIFFSN